MAGARGEHDVGELWGKVETLEGGLTNLGGIVDRGFKSLADTIQRNQERTDERIATAQQRTDTKFESFALSFQQSTSQKATSTLTIIGMLLTAFIGFGGLLTGAATVAFAFYTLTKQPIDANFSSIYKTQEQQAADIKSNQKDTSNKIDNMEARFVPIPEIRGIESNVTKIQDEGRERDKLIAAIGANQQRNTQRGDNFERQLDEHHQLYVDKSLFDELQHRVNKNEDLVQQLWEKNYATPKFPCLDSGAGCGPVGTPGPTSLPSTSGQR